MKLRLHLALLALAFGTAAHAQLSLTSAVDLAFKSNPKVLSAKADVDHARAVLSETKDSYVPVVGAQGGVGKSTGVPLSLPTIFSINAQSLVFNWSQRDYIRSAHLGWDATQLAWRQAQDDAAEDVVLTYLALDYAQQRRTAAEDALGYAQKLLSIVNDRVAAGQDAHSLIPRTHLQVIDLQQQLLHIDNDIAELSDHLGRITGLPGSNPTTIHGTIPALPEVSSLTTGASLLPETSPAIQALFVTAQSKFELAHGDARYLYRPQVSFAANYSRITTDFTNYALYYPGFSPDRLANKSLNSLSVGVAIQLPLLDQAHRAKARESAADARKAKYDAISGQNQFLEGRLKLTRAASDLDLQTQRAQDNAEIAQDDLEAVLLQLAPDATPPGQPLTPKDEQSARLAVAQRKLDLLNARLQLDQTKLQLMKQRGTLATWVHSALVPVQP